MLKNRKKLMAKLLCVVMCTSLIPTTMTLMPTTTAFAAGTTITKAVTISSASLSLVKKATSQLTVKSNTTGGKTVAWTSNNAKVATVSTTGKVTAVAAGKATITCTSGGKTATCTVTVTDPIASLTVKSLNLVKGSTTVTGQLIKTVSPATANQAVTWSSSNKAVATVDTNGKVTAVGAGTTTITCTAADGSGKKATSTVTVTQLVTGISLTSSLNLAIGNVSTLKGTVAPSTASNKAVTWSSSDKAVATVDTNGKVTAIGAGIATITCAAKDASKKTATSTVTVTKASGQIIGTWTPNTVFELLGAKIGSLQIKADGTAIGSLSNGSKITIPYTITEDSDKNCVLKFTKGSYTKSITFKFVGNSNNVINMYSTGNTVAIDENLTRK